MRTSPVVLIAVLGLLAGCTGHHTPPSRPGRSVTRTVQTPLSASAPSVSRLADEPGSPWRIPRRDDHGIAGFSDPTSVLPGQRVQVYVSTSAARFRVRAFRMGWYRGSLGRLTWTSAGYPGHRQPRPQLVAPGTRTVAARWSPSLTIDTAGWAPGDYLLCLDGTGGRRQFVPLTVRGRSAAGRVVLVSPITTWQAYNLWGCCDLYQGADGEFATRSRAVSFDRPYLQESGAGQFIDAELPVVAEAERLGLPLDYVTDIDIDSVPHLIDGARAVVSMGHDEYWSPAMRAALTQARNAGTNLAFLGANAIFRRIRLAPTVLGPDRLEINYKVATEDPLYGRDNPAVTANWPAPPATNPESRLLGAQYGCLQLGSTIQPGVIADPHSWLFHSSHVTAGERLPGLIGPEIDAVQLGYPTPRPIDVLLHSPTRCPHNAPAAADTTYYVAHSGAAVFDAGTIAWARDVLGNRLGRVPNLTATIVRTVTDNLLLAFAHSRAGRQHPARDNFATLDIGG